MIRVLLSPSQREALFSVPADLTEQELVKQYTFSGIPGLIEGAKKGLRREGCWIQLGT